MYIGRYNSTSIYGDFIIAAFKKALPSLYYINNNHAIDHYKDMVVI